MPEFQKDILLSKKREYYKRSTVVTECPPNVALLSTNETTLCLNSTTINQSESYQLTKCINPVEAPPHRNNTANYKRLKSSLDNGQATQFRQSNVHIPTSTIILIFITSVSYIDLESSFRGQRPDRWSIWDIWAHCPWYLCWGYISIFSFTLQVLHQLIWKNYVWPLYYLLDCVGTVQHGEEATYHEPDEEARIFSEQRM
jgi:hypothetical protein